MSSDGGAPIMALGQGVLPHDLSPWAMFISADSVVQAVMVALALASVVTWSIVLAKGWELRRGKRRVGRILGYLTEARGLADALRRRQDEGGPEFGLIVAAAAESGLSDGLPAAGIKERMESRLRRIEVALGRRMALGTGILATIGAVAPFVGLFGTVWGIMNSFVGISRAQTTNLAVVAPGIAEALMATAIGLVAAIPAVIVYNVFARAIAGYRASLADASAEILRLAGRDLDRGGLRHKAAAE